MTPEQIAQLEKSVKETIEKTVNGKINRLDQKLDEYIKHDMEWKETVQPVIDAYTTVNKVGSFVQWISKVILAIGVIVGVLFYTQNK